MEEKPSRRRLAPSSFILHPCFDPPATAGGSDSCAAQIKLLREARFLLLLGLIEGRVRGELVFLKIKLADNFDRQGLRRAVGNLELAWGVVLFPHARECGIVALGNNDVHAL